MVRYFARAASYGNARRHDYGRGWFAIGLPKVPQEPLSSGVVGRGPSSGSLLWVPGRRDGPLADLFGQGDDDSRGAAEVAEPIAVLVLRHLAEEVGAVGAQAGDGVVDVVDGKHDTMQA